jgi:hypothetical protein
LPSLAEHQSNDFTKLLLLGDAKSGKTTALWSLVKAGYKLRILDMDNLLDSLKEKLVKECPGQLANVEYRTLRDKYKFLPDGTVVVDGAPKAFMSAMKMLDHWKYDDTDLGKPKEWGPDCILVVDSLSRLCDAAYDFNSAMAKPGKSGEIDGRSVYGAAQDAVESVLANLTSENFCTNVIVICHGVYMTLPDGQKVFPQGVGQKLSPKIPQYFPVYVRFKNFAGTRTVQIVSDPIIDLAMPKIDAFKEKSLPVETGLATIFNTLRGKVEVAAPAAVAKPAATVLRRR